MRRARRAPGHAARSETYNHAWQTRLVPFDVDRALDDLVGEVFVAETEVVRDLDPDWPGFHRLRLRSADGARAAGIRASDDLFVGQFLDLDLSISLWGYGDDRETSSALHELALVVREYLRGNGHVEFTRRRFLRPPTPVLTIEINGHSWQIGRQVSSSPF